MSKNYMPALLRPNSNKWVLVSILFSLFYFLPLFFMLDVFSELQLYVIIITYIIFLSLYYWGVKSDSDHALLPIILILTLSFIITFITPGSNALFCFATFLGGYYLPIKRAVAVLVVTLVAVAVAFTLSSYSIVYIGMAGLLSVAHFFTAILVQQDLQHRFTKERDQGHIQQLATIAERERISRDLHDLLGHSLTGIALKAELAEKFVGAQRYDSAALEISAVAELARSTLSDMRESVSGLKQKGLSAELNKLCQQLEAAEFNTLREDEVSGGDNLTAEVESIIILLLKESCTNILRHSKGDKARLSVVKKQGTFLINVWDNGSSTSLEPGNGIHGMEERCIEMGGRLTLERSEKGTLLSMTIPGDNLD